MVSKKIAASVRNGSAIRAMFEQGEILRRKFGPENVFDFSLGNPDLEPPKEVTDSLTRLVTSGRPNLHKYMANAGYSEVRARIAAQVALESGLPVNENHIVMTCGAAGGLNVVLKTILEPGDEVIVIAPFFVEYLSYIDNHGGTGVIVPSRKEDFQPDIGALSRAITPKTRGIILNSPNNPTGVIYTEQVLKEMSELLEKKEKEFGTSIVVISDEPYARLIYDGIKLPNILSIFRNSCIVNSFSKSLALPGERIGYIAANPNMDEIDLFMDGLKLCNRTLGFVNAPSLFQLVVAESLNAPVAVREYEERRNLMYNKLIELGFKCIKPQGAFYLFPQSPIPDDVEFAKQAAEKYNLLVVPGKGFGCPGYVRIAYCVSQDTIRNSFPAFEKLAKEYIK